jgi:iron complex transport system substrate-binding protein
MDRQKAERSMASARAASFILLAATVLAGEVNAEPQNVEADRAPAIVQSCERSFAVSGPPKRALVYGANLTEMMLSLGLESRMVGTTSVRPPERRTIASHFPAIKDLKSISDQAPTLEVLLDADIDFLFAGWHAGLRPGGDITPKSLARFGIPVYEATETCAYVGQNAAPTLDYLFRDLRNLGAIFGVSARAERLIEDYQARLQRVRAAVNDRAKPSVFVYSAGDRLAFSAGGMSMLQAIIEAAGGENVAAHVRSSWLYMNWETVIDRNPAAIIMVEPEGSNAEQRIAFFSSRPGLAELDAVKNRKFIILPYHTTIPGPFNVDAVETVARALHPDAFDQSQPKPRGAEQGASPDTRP